jgi:hypothetical protein
MESTSDSKGAFVRAIFEQHWQQIRQVQRERLWVLLVFSVVCVGALAIMRGDIANLNNWPLLVFLMVLSLMGLFLSIKMQVAVRAHLSAAELILSRYSLNHYLPRYRLGFVRKLVRISRMIPKFFLFCFSFFLWMLLYSASANWVSSVVIAGSIYVVSAVIVYFTKFDDPLPFEGD